MAHSLKSCLKNYQENEKDLELIETIPPLPGHLSSPFTVTEV